MHEGHGNGERFLLFRRKEIWEWFIVERLRSLLKEIRTVESWFAKWDEKGSRRTWTDKNSTRKSQNGQNKDKNLNSNQGETAWVDNRIVVK